MAADGGAIDARRSAGGPVVGVIAAGFAAVHLYNAYTGMLTGMQLSAVHLGFALVLVFLLYPSVSPLRSRWWRALDLLLVGVAVVITGYLFEEYPKLTFRAGDPTTTDIVLGTVAIILVLEATRRILGSALPAIAVAFIVYAVVGPYMPDMIAHSGYSWDRIVEHMYLTAEGIFGIPLATSATYIVLFVAFGAFLNDSGGGPFFIKLAQAGFGQFRGGPAKVAVASSTLFGSITGSAVANAGTVGPLTIPVMKKVGFSAQYAAAVESVASCGSQLMPPVMGASAFLIAEFLRVGYGSVAIAALVPALLYYAALFAMVDFKAARGGMRGLPRVDLPRARAVLLDGGHLLTGPIVLIVMLAVFDASPARSAFWGIVASYGASLLRRGTRMTPAAVGRTLRTAGIGTLEVALATACAGLIIGTFTLTGLGVRFSGLIVDLAGGNLLALLFLTVVASLVLGTGLPTVPTYLLLAILVAPALTSVGVDPLAAHMFIFYFGAIADMTPPLAMSAMVAAGIAGADPFKTTFTASRIGIVGYLIPFMFVFNRAYLLRGGVVEIALALLAGVVGVIALAAALEGYLLDRSGPIDRLLLLGAALLLIAPSRMADIGGYALFALVLFHQYYDRKTRLAAVGTAGAR